MKNLIKSIIFLSIFFILFYYIFNILWLDKTPIAYFHDEPKNSFDVVYIGASNVYRHFNPLLAYDLYGYKTGNLSSSSQPFAAVKYLINETKKNQSPQLYVIDIAKLVDDWDYFKETYIRKATDSMYFSKDRIDAINEILDYKGVEKSEYINYYFSFFLYHNRWKKIQEKNFVGTKMYKGYITDDENGTVSEISPQKAYKWNFSEGSLTEDNKQILLDLIGYIKENNLNVLFVIPKRYFNEKAMMGFNYATSIIEENELKVINFNTVEDFDVDFSTDFLNSNHLNTYGATKYTLYFSKYLKENYDLPYQRENEDSNSWNTE